MKKITGKVVSLVLALALVVTSFSSTFAFAATSETATAKLAKDTLYLSNGGATTADLTADVYSALTSGATFSVYDHSPITTTPVLKEVTISSGSGIAKLGTVDVAAAVPVILQAADVTGTVTVAARYEGGIQRTGDTEATKLYATATLTLKVLPKNSTVVAASGFTSGAGNVGAYPPAAADLTKYVGATPASVTLDAYTVGQTGNAFATFTSVGADKLVMAGSAATAYTDKYKVTLSSGACVTPTITAGAAGVKLEVKLANSNAAGTDSPFASVGNVGVNVVKCSATGVASSAAIDNSNTVVKIANRVDLPAANDKIYQWKGVTYASSAAVTSTAAGVTNTAGAINITGADVTLGGDTIMTSGSIGNVNGDANLDVQNGYVASIGKDGGSTNPNTVSVEKGTVGKVYADTSITVTGGKVADVAAPTVTVSASDEKVPTSVGAISAKDVNVGTTTDKAAVSTGSIKSNAASGKVTLAGEKSTVGAIDYDYYNTGIEFAAFKGSVAAPAHCSNGYIASTLDDSKAVITGALNIPTLTVTAGTITLADAAKVGSISGSGVLAVKPNALYVTGGLDSVSLKFTTAFKVGDTVLSADSYKVYPESFKTVGYTLEKVEGTKVDTFKIKTVDFANIVLDKSDVKMGVGSTETFTVSSYPAGTKLPDGTSVKWEFTGNSDYFTFTSNGMTASVKALKRDGTFASLNQGTVKATLVDEYGFPKYGYDPATSDVTIIDKTFTSDTNADFSVESGKTYQFKLTSLNGSVPTLVFGTSGVFTVAPVVKDGNDYYVKITATGKVGAGTGVYVNGQKLLVATVKAATVKCDTTVAIKVAAGKSYTYKVTADATPSFGFGTGSVFTVSAIKKVGNDYFFTVSPVKGAKSGAATGVFVNGTRVNVATVA